MSNRAGTGAFDSMLVMLGTETVSLDRLGTGHWSPRIEAVIDTCASRGSAPTPPPPPNTPRRVVILPIGAVPRELWRKKSDPLMPVDVPDVKRIAFRAVPPQRRFRAVVRTSSCLREPRGGLGLLLASKGRDVRPPRSSRSTADGCRSWHHTTNMPPLVCSPQ